jgi:nucleotide-binding universal stress UspA family protein
MSTEHAAAGAARTLVYSSVFRYCSLMFQTVVVGADDSPSAAEAVRQAIDLVKLTGGKLHIVTAYSHQQLTSGGTGEPARTVSSAEFAQGLLDDLASDARLVGVDVTVHSEPGHPAHVILQVANEVDADLIVVGNKGMKGARRVLGSVPNSVAHDATCSVLITATA